MTGRRLLLVCVAALLLTSCTSSDDSEPEVPTAAPASPGAVAESGKLDDAWKRGLKAGPNGPIPVIVVDQFGYRPQARKVAVLRRPMTGFDAGSDYTPGSRIEVVDAATGDVRSTRSATPWRDGAEDAVSGDRAWWFDFSDLTTPGEYFVRDPERNLRSPTFVIGDGVYRQVLADALRAFFYQRAGQDKSEQLAGAWADGASHLGPGQDGEARSWLDKGAAATQRDLRGGWYDAGDYNKYTPWHASYLLALLHTYREHPDVISDDLGIPESGNGVSDLADEIVWGLDWLERMQLDNGSVLCIEGLDPASPPSAATGPSYYGPATTFATYRAASTFALAGSVFRDSGVPALAARATRLADRARSAWTWAAAHPSDTYFNNDPGQQPGSEGLGGGQQETDQAGRTRARVESAVYLYGLTADASYREIVEAQWASMLPEGGPTQWTQNEQEFLLYYASLPGATSAGAVRDGYLSAFAAGPLADAVSASTLDGADPYRAHMADYTWGSNQSKSAMGRLLALGHAYGLKDPAAEAGFAVSEEYLHSLHGVNPLGLVYLTNMGGAGAEHSADTLYHTWFAQGTRWDQLTASTPGPPPGFLVGGPNPYYKPDACCADDPACYNAPEASYCTMPLSPPKDQPPSKSYLQFNEGWPANSWEVTENSNGYQVQYIRLLAAFAS